VQFAQEMPMCLSSWPRFGGNWEGTIIQRETKKNQKKTNTLKDRHVERVCKKKESQEHGT
jgi:hypothetical protein